MTTTRQPAESDRKRVSRPPPGVPDPPPANTLDLIYRMWMSFGWGRAGALALVLLSAGVALAMVVGAFAVASSVAGGSPLLSAGGAAIAGAGAATGVYDYVRRRRRGRRKDPH